MSSPFGAPTVAPVNAPPAASPGIGVQPGLSNGVIAANIVIVFGPADGIFVYSGTPGLGTLIGSWAGMAGVDRFGNVYPQGLNVTQGAISGSTFSGSDFIINTSGMFFYSGTPANGNLVASIAPTVTTDSFGNTVKPGGFAAYGSTGQIAFFGVSGSGSQVNNFFSGNANEKSPSTIASAAIGSGGTAFIGAAIEGPVINLSGHADWVGIQFNSPNFGGTSSANGSIFYVDNAGTVHQVAHWDNTGFNIDIGPGNVVTDVTQRNSTTSATTQITPSYSIPANLMVAGSSWELELFLAGNQNASAATTLEFFFQVNGNNTAITLPTGFTTTNGAFRGSARMVVACKIPGPANTASIFINGEVKITQTTFAIANSNIFSVSSPNAQGPNASVDTTVVQACAISTAWGSSGSLGGLWSRFTRLS